MFTLEYVKIDNKYNYLIDIPIYKMTKDEVKHFEDEIQKLKLLFEEIEKKTIQEMWLEDLTEFELNYDKFLKLKMDKYKK